jgi:hypothetical protein
MGAGLLNWAGFYKQPLLTELNGRDLAGFITGEPKPRTKPDLWPANGSGRNWDSSVKGASFRRAQKISVPFFGGVDIYR